MSKKRSGKTERSITATAVIGGGLLLIVVGLVLSVFGIGGSQIVGPISILDIVKIEHVPKAVGLIVLGIGLILGVLKLWPKGWAQPWVPMSGPGP